MKELAAWYQKKISSYDKAEWETLVERLLVRGEYRRRVIDPSAHLPRSYLIDVDLVRGSSFPKAKATLGVWRVLWLAAVRLALLPAMLRWWRQQTSATCARLLLALWLLQAADLLLYSLAPPAARAECDAVLVPLALMVALSVVHAHIVSTTAPTSPRHHDRRKLPEYYRRPRRDRSGGGPDSAHRVASSKQSKGQAAKCAKFRRRASLARAKGEETEEPFGSRKRTETPAATAAEPKCGTSEAKDSDDDDYMDWKRAPATPPTVTLTPPPEDNDGGDPFQFKPVLTRRRLEKLNGGHNRPSFGDDDGFESLNGNCSNGSDNEGKPKCADRAVGAGKFVTDRAVAADNDDSIFKNSRTKEDRIFDVEQPASPENYPLPKRGVLSSPVVLKSSLSKDGKCADSSDGVEGSGKKRTGVRFRNSWVQGVLEHGSGGRSSEAKARRKKPDTCDTSSSEGGCETASAPSVGPPSHQTASDWVGQTTNSEECSYSSQSEDQESEVGYRFDSTWDPFSILNPASDTVKCLMWEKGEMLKAELSAVDISWCVVARAERAMAADGGYLWAGVAMAAVIALLAPVTRLLQVALTEFDKLGDDCGHWLLEFPGTLWDYSGGDPRALMRVALGENVWVATMNSASLLLRFALSGVCFFLLGVAERAYKQRLLYAKLFSQLTSARRARQSELPHFRLHTVRNIKAWLSVRSYLRRRGPQRSVDVIVSSAFVVTVTLLACVAAQLLREGEAVECGWVLEVVVWCACLGVYLLRLLTLGSNVNRKYRGCLSAIITEQINLHLAVEQRPASKERLALANNVLKLAADLLKELDAPFKISGICANHYLYTITKVVILSALSGVLSEMLGFKLKLHKIKIK